MSKIELTPDQEAEAQRLAGLIGQKVQEELLQMYRLLGYFPWDDVLRLTEQRLTPAAQEVTALAGIQESFGKAAERMLPKLAGIKLSESTVERTTEAAGEELGQALEEGRVFGPKQTWDWHKDRTGKTCAYVSLDSTGILMQGRAFRGAIWLRRHARLAFVGLRLLRRQFDLECRVHSCSFFLLSGAIDGNASNSEVKHFPAKTTWAANYGKESQPLTARVTSSQNGLADLSSSPTNRL
jgi:hypothetical protein